MKNNIRELLKINNMTEKELACKLKMTETSVSRYINGVRIPNVITAIRMAEILNCKVEDLFSIIRPEVIENYKKYHENINYLLNKIENLNLTKAEKDELKRMGIYTTMYICK